MNLEALVDEIRNEARRIFPGAHFLGVEALPFYNKTRIVLAENLFIEIRINSRNRRRSYALIHNQKRISGFDNLDTWHLHPFEDPDTHHKIAPPSPQKVFIYFKNGLRPKNKTARIEGR